VPARRNRARDGALPLTIAETAEPSFSMLPTGSWPIVKPFATGYSPFKNGRRGDTHEGIERTDFGNGLFVE
jgi:hypothetical protein